MVYLDTSVIIAAITDEPENQRVWSWLAQQAEGSLATSDWTNTEVSSALSLKVRTKVIGVADRANALSAWRRLRADNLAIDPVDPKHFRAAAAFADRQELGLRAGDALHIAQRLPATRLQPWIPGWRRRCRFSVFRSRRYASNVATVASSGSVGQRQKRLL